MSISRRGLAAGLTFVAVGAIAVTVTPNAAADQTPVSTTAAAPATTAEAQDGRATPPPPLPGAGRSRASGSSAAGAAAPPPPTATPKYAPKGVAPVPATTASPGTAPARPRGAAGATSRAAAAQQTNYLYTTAAQYVESDGAYGYFTVAKPSLAAGDFHSLAEVAARSRDGRQIVEVGWTVDPSVNGNDQPHLFVFHWVDNRPGCYNACGFVQHSTTVRPGAALPVGSVMRFTIRHFGTGWWIGYGSEWVGYFPDSLWNGTFTRTGLVQWFGEVAAPSLEPCTDMGNGQWADAPQVEKPQAAVVERIGFFNDPPLKANITKAEANSAYYKGNASGKNKDAFTYGGPGAC